METHLVMALLIIGVMLGQWSHTLYADIFTGRYVQYVLEIFVGPNLNVTGMGTKNWLHLRYFI